MPRGKRTIQHRPTNDLNLGSCTRCQIQIHTPLPTATLAHKSGPHEQVSGKLVATPVGRHRSTRALRPPARPRPLQPKRARSGLAVDERRRTSRANSLTYLRGRPQGRKAGKPGEVLLRAVPVVSGTSGRGSEAATRRHTPRLRSALLRLPTSRR
jgi:hypothetical protein